jgi:hypothetical protein
MTCKSKYKKEIRGCKFHLPIICACDLDKQKPGMT